MRSNTASFFLFLFCFVCYTRGSFVLVVGDVSSYTVRVLHESLIVLDYKSCLFDENGKLLSERHWEYSHKPRILSFSNLDPGRSYKICFEVYNIQNRECEDFVNFATVSLQSGTQNFTVVSCNRYIEDRDTFMWDQLTDIHKQQKVHSGAFHLGDQIYADYVPHDFVSQYGELLLDKDACVPFKNLLGLFRSYYGITWSHRAMHSTLRWGPNWMIPDDHELINNANPEFWREVVSPPKQPELGQHLVKFVMRAGIQSYLEYQYQLYDEIPDLSAAQNCCIPSHSDPTSADDCNSIWDQYDDTVEQFLHDRGFSIFRKLGRTAVIMLDSRYERIWRHSSIHDSAHPWLGTAGFARFEAQIAELESDYKNIDKILIFTGTPMFFASSLLARLAYSVEGDKYPTHPDIERDLKKVMERLFRSPMWDKFVLLSGDLHIYFESEICDWYTNRCIPQVITSGMSIGSNAIGNNVAYLYDLIAFRFWKPWLFTRNLLLTVNYSAIFMSNNFLTLEIDNGEIQYHYYWRPLETNRDLLLQLLFDYAATLVYLIAITIISIIFTSIVIKRKQRRNRREMKKQKKKRK